MAISGYLSKLGFGAIAGFVSKIGFGEVSGCNLYLFSSGNADSLQLGSAFTGNLKVQTKALAETGLHPDIIAGRQGAFIADTWMQYEIEAVSLTYVVDATFNGRVAYAKNDVWFNVDMGAVVVPPDPPEDNAPGVWNTTGVWN